MNPHDEQAKATTFFFTLNSAALFGLKRTGVRLPWGNVSPSSRSVEPHLGQASIFIGEAANVTAQARRAASAESGPVLHSIRPDLQSFSVGGCEGGTESPSRRCLKQSG